MAGTAPAELTVEAKAAVAGPGTQRTTISLYDGRGNEVSRIPVSIGVEAAAA